MLFQRKHINYNVHQEPLSGTATISLGIRTHLCYGTIFQFFRTNCPTLTTYIHADSRTSRGFSRGSCHVAWSYDAESCEVLLRIFHCSRGMRYGALICRADCRAMKQTGPSKKLWCKRLGSTITRKFRLLPVCSLDSSRNSTVLQSIWISNPFSRIIFVLRLMQKVCFSKTRCEWKYLLALVVRTR